MLGDAPNDGGLNLRPQPSTDAWFKTPQKIADRTKLLVDRQAGKDWAHVTLTDGRSGWVDSQFVDTRWPEPDAQLHRVVAGDSAFSLAHQYYEQDARLIRGIDKRFFVTVLAYVNPHLNIDDLRPSPAEYLWVPSARFAFSLASILSHGTLTGGAWAELSGAWSGAWGAAEGALNAAWTYAEGSVAFDVGLIQGAWDAVWSTVTGLAGLAKVSFEVVWALVRDLLTGTLVGKAGDLWNMATHLDLGKLLGAAGTAVGLALKDVAAKWNDPDVIKRWNFRGFVVGEALVQVLLTVFSGGAFAALKAVSRAGEVADLIARVPAVERLVGAAGDLKGAGAEALRGALTGLKGAQEWAATVLKIPAEVLVDLSEDAINRLKTLPPWLQERLSQLNVPGLRRVLGCASPCLVNIDEVKAWLTTLAVDGARAGERLLTTAQEVIDALGLPSWADTSKIQLNLVRLKILDVIREAGLTDKDFEKFKFFIPSARRSMSADDTYYTFTAYLNTMIPAKFGPNVERLRAFTARMIRDAADAGRQGRGLQAFMSSSKGAMFENFVKMYVPEFSAASARRAVMIRANGTRALCDYFIEATGAVWDFKNQEEALAANEVDKYENLVGQAMTTDRHPVQSVNFLFTADTLAGRNWARLNAKGYKIWYLMQVDSHTLKPVELLHWP